MKLCIYITLLMSLSCVSAFHPYPLVIEGAGEGAKQAASSILNDILK